MSDMDEMITVESEQFSILFGRIAALGALIDMLWTNELAKTDDPIAEAKELKDTVLSLVKFDPGDPVQAEAVDETKRRLDSILHRVKHLDTPLPDRKN